ncbi:hypothetical protein [Streptomyces sp. YIM 121038]|uniref:hypothetical protein n=1 Tax=Streptomyces sp. YIM 121038 TaxID=2136401 RepID=UPI001110F55A|nr:hypothetical protein [Streptomyces sp. YIM 121038]
MNATRADIIAMLHDGHSARKIARSLHCAKTRVVQIRRELGLPVFVQATEPDTAEEKWAQFVQPAEHGHLEWTGPLRATTPVMRHKGKHYSPAAIAFRIQHGREPKGMVFAECGRPHCVAPAHVEDEPGRLRAREQFRYLRGGRERKPFCGQGHDQAEHGRYGPDGTAYCAACNTVQARARRAVTP